MKVLVVGAGSVGQTYGYHLHRGGASVTFFVKAQYVGDLQAHPLTLHRLYLGGWAASWLDRSPRNEFTEYDVVASEEEVRAGKYEYVIFTPTHDALVKDDFAKKIVAWAGPQAAIVSTMTSVADFFEEELKVDKSRLILNAITTINWQAPLEGESFQPVPPATGPNKAIAYLLESPLPFDGPAGLTQPLIAAFNKGGLAATAMTDIVQNLAVVESSFLPVLLGLALNDWKVAKLIRSPQLKLVVAAAAESRLVSAKKHGQPPSVLADWIAGQWFFRFLGTFAPYVMPFDLDVYFQFHFGFKCKQQTELIANSVAVLAKKFNVPTPALDQLIALQSK